MSKAELELLVIEEIRKHRCLMKSDEIVYEEWVAAKAQAGLPRDQIEKLEAECLIRRKKTAAQQDALADLLDLLGYIPKVPEGGAEEINRDREDRDLSRSQPRG